MPEYRVDCVCGKYLTVTGGSVGAKLSCECGREVAVPTLRELREQAGEVGYKGSPELLVEHHLATGSYPTNGQCVDCLREAEEVLTVELDCERTLEKGGDSGVFGMLLTMLLFLPLGLFVYFRRRERGRQIGQDRVYRLPLEMCGPCRHVVRKNADVRERLLKVPVYRQLLEKYPRAKIRSFKESGSQ